MEKNISKSIIELCEGMGTSYVSGLEAVKKIRAFFKESECSPKDIEILFRNPDKELGSFEALPKIFREGLANSAHFHIQEMNLLTSFVVRTLAYGPISRMGEWLIHQGWRLKGTRLGWMHYDVVLLGRKIFRACRIVCRTYLRLFRFTGLYRAPFPHMLWKYVNFDPWNLIQGYIKNIRLDPRLSPVFKCARQSATSCGLVGIDFLPSKGKLYFLESNFNAGHRITRHLLFSKGDTVCNHLVNWVAINGYLKIIFFPHNFQAIFEKDLEDAWRRIAQKRGICLEIVDDPIIGSPWPRSRGMLMNCQSPGTIYVNGRHLVSPLSRLISEKGLLEQEIRRFNDSIQQDEDKIPVPKVIFSEEDIPQVDDDALFPNIIVKNARLDQAKGISLYKSKQIPAEANSYPNIAYEYVTPDLEVKEEEGGIQHYVYIFRAYLLITPDGPVYLGARKDISSRAVPNTLPFGMIDDKSRYIANYYSGAYPVAHTEAEDEVCRDAVLSLGTVVFRFLREKHILTLE